MTKGEQSMQKSVSVSNDVKELNIDLSYGMLYIEDGQEFSLDMEWVGENEIFAEEDGACLRIWNERKNKRIPISQKQSDVMTVKMTIPADKIFEKVRIVSGAGEYSVDRLTTGSLILRVGAGELRIGNLAVSNFAQIESGAGEVTIEDGSIHNLSMELGAGVVVVKAELTGQSKIKAGVGELILKLIGNPEDYSATVTKGLGICSLDGFSFFNGNTYGNGENHLEVNGGIGVISVSFD